MAEMLIALSRRYLREYLTKIRLAVSVLDDDIIWARPNESSNSIGNLMLHLAGNVRQWIVSGVGGAPDVRDRPREFAEQSGAPAAQLLDDLRAAVREADAVLGRLTAAQLVEPRRIQGFETNVLAAVFNVVAHFQGHTQEIIHITRARLGDAYRFDFVPQGLEQLSAGGSGV